MAKVLSIEVGETFSKIVEMDYKVKSPKIYKYLTFETPENTVDDGVITDPESLGETIKSFLQSNGLKTKQAVFSVTSNKIATREVIIPAVKLSQVDNVVLANATEYFPIDLSEYEIGHLILENIVGEDGVPKLKTLVMACSKELIRGYDSLCQKIGLHLTALDYCGNSIFQMMKHEVKEETEMVLRVEEHATIATIISGETLKMQRNIAYGIDGCIETMIATNAFPQETYKECLEELGKNTCIRLAISENTVMLEREDEKQVNEKTAKAIKDMTEALAPLINNISRLIDLYNSKNFENPIKKVSLVGLGSEVCGLSKLFTNELGIKCVMTDTLKSIVWDSANGKGNSGEYVTAIGAAISPIGFVNEEKKKNDFKEVNYTSTSILVAVLALVSAVALFALSYYPYKDEKEINDSLKTQEQAYLPAEETYNAYNAVKDFYTPIREGYLMTQSPNDNLLQFLDDLEKNLPESAVVTQIDSNNEQASITMRVSGMEQAAKVIQTIRGFDSVADVAIGAFSQEESEEAEEDLKEEIEEAVVEVLEGVKDIEDVEIADFMFNIICTYRPLVSSSED